jgi:hypothetical protein
MVDGGHTDLALVNLRSAEDSAFSSPFSVLGS